MMTTMTRPQLWPTTNLSGARRCHHLPSCITLAHIGTTRSFLLRSSVMATNSRQGCQLDHVLEVRLNRRLSAVGRRARPPAKWGVQLATPKSRPDALTHAEYLVTTPPEYYRFVSYFFYLYSVNQKNPHWGFLTFFPKRLGIFSPNFTRPLCIPIYARCVKSD